MAIKNFYKILVILILFPIFVFSKDRSRISLGLGQFNFMEDGTPPHKQTSEMLNFEIYSGKKLFNLVKPFAGVLGTSSNAYYAYAGFGIDGYYTKKKILSSHRV